jgi:hypothetical protein
MYGGPRYRITYIHKIPLAMSRRVNNTTLVISKMLSTNELFPFISVLYPVFKSNSMHGRNYNEANEANASYRK